MQACRNLRWMMACCATAWGAGGLQAQEQPERLNTQIEVAEDLARKTGRPILALAGKET